ncbi:hypothetical protein N781_03970 [Pontibacillus halophilus JSM 076056 = DSM 19796]|uniref:CAAX prenyl protease 2/Lysostaphin resistance protein A-like domain-containing protein n=1 Tax=Pontibacillus halophilus JSM 076056 = DSM 19796 TaxID=1385510 RepID=A0A0A5GI57_9BACI|nr:type II CAAX endopeptidase family protein [Pontibacillus halophilus]KGX91694.1 hypothetical protein N781_03970 [Pontibacillus halophilus JSM 076056 = DSM 19796]
MKNVYLIAILTMGFLSFSNFFGVKIAGISVVIGIVFFFIVKSLDGKDDLHNNLSIKDFGTILKDRSIWFWISSPLLMNVFCFSFAVLLLPEFIEHLNTRTGPMVSFNTLLLVVLQLGILALGEEIAWRGFFQKQLNKWLPIIPTLILTSFLFSFAHFAMGDSVVVIFDSLFIFINSVLYGFIFYRTNNLWVSAFSHFIANVFSVLVISIL